MKVETYGKLVHELAVLLGSLGSRHRCDAEFPRVSETIAGVSSESIRSIEIEKDMMVGSELSL